MDTSQDDIPQLNLSASEALNTEPITPRLKRSLEQLLAHFVTDPQSLISVLSHTGSLITGDAALTFMLFPDTCPKPPSLKISCPMHQYDAVIAYFTGSPCTSITKTNALDHLNVHILDRTQGILSNTIVQNTHGIIDVVQSNCHSAYHPIPFQKGTHLMNVLSPAFFICPYPNLTAKRITIIPDTPSGTDHTAVSPWLDQLHFTCLSSPCALYDLRESCYNFHACSKRVRTFGDDGTMLITFGAADDNSVTDPLSTCTAWRLGGWPCGNRRCFLEINRSVETFVDT